MTQAEIINALLEQSERDLKTANDFFKSKHFVWCLFTAHLALEKLLKAISLKQGKERLYIHNLYKLAKHAEISLTTDQELELEMVTDFNIETRYDDYKSEFYKKATHEYAEVWLRKCIALHNFFKAQI